MKKYFLIGLIVAIVPSICLGQSTRYTQLVREKQRKMEELEKCMGASKGLQIAGLSTLGLTAVGVAGNIAEAQKRDSYEADMKSIEKKIKKLDDEIAEENEKKELIKQNVEEEDIQKIDFTKAAYALNCQTSGGTMLNELCLCKFGEPDSEGKCSSTKKKDAEPKDIDITQKHTTTQIAIDAVFGDDEKTQKKKTNELFFNKQKPSMLTQGVIDASVKAAAKTGENDGGDDGGDDGGSEDDENK